MKTFIIAEAGVNHNGSLQLAKQLVDVAVEAGADAIKFQSFFAEDLVCVGAPKADYQKARKAADEESQYEMLKSLELSEGEQAEIAEYCQKRSILFLSSPFDSKSVDFLHQSLDLPIIKIPSGEITHLPLLLHIARTRKKVILSTGMSTLGEIEMALAVLAYGYLYPDSDLLGQYQETYFSAEGQEILREKVSLLHCTTEYPSPFYEVNLRAMQTLKQTFGLPVGYSDHTLGIAVSIAAVACGATIIEKHFTLNKTLAGPDHQASLEPNELVSMVAAIRQVELAMGSDQKIPTQSEIKNRLIARKSLVSLTAIQKGEKFTIDNLGCKRPGNGISPGRFYEYVGKIAEYDYKKDELIG